MPPESIAFDATPASPVMYAPLYRPVYEMNLGRCGYPPIEGGRGYFVIDEKKKKKRKEERERRGRNLGAR